jgi:hypothetical protein
MNAVFKINRYSESGVLPLRSDRFYQEANKWYFSIRAELDHGPFETFDDARYALTEYIKETLSS